MIVVRERASLAVLIVSRATHGSPQQRLVWPASYLSVEADNVGFGIADKERGADTFASRCGSGYCFCSDPLPDGLKLNNLAARDPDGK